MGRGRTTAAEKYSDKKEEEQQQVLSYIIRIYIRMIYIYIYIYNIYKILRLKGDIMSSACKSVTLEHLLTMAHVAYLVHLSKRILLVFKGFIVFVRGCFIM